MAFVARCASGTVPPVQQAGLVEKTCASAPEGGSNGKPLGSRGDGEEDRSLGPESAVEGAYDSAGNCLRESGEEGKGKKKGEKKMGGAERGLCITPVLDEMGVKSTAHVPEAPPTYAACRATSRGCVTSAGSSCADMALHGSGRRGGPGEGEGHVFLRRFESRVDDISEGPTDAQPLRFPPARLAHPHPHLHPPRRTARADDALRHDSTRLASTRLDSPSPPLLDHPARENSRATTAGRNHG